MLATREFTADYLADWMIRPVPKRPEVQPDAWRVISRYQPVGELSEAGYRISVQGDGTVALIDIGAGTPPRQCDHDELRAMMLDLLDGKFR